jgi:predicted dehydrogenase
MTPGAPLGLGFVGAGGFATFLGEAVSDLDATVIRAVTDPDPFRASGFAARHGAWVCSSWLELVEDPDVDVVVVATPPADHARITRAALDSGRHVFCEKPLATTRSDLRSVLDAAQRAGQALVVDHVLRFNPILRALQRLQGSLLGPAQRFSFDNDASDEHLSDGHWFWDPAQSGGIFVEHGVHFFDAAQMLLGRPATAVTASAARRPGAGYVDMVSAIANHGEGVLATHTHSFTHARRCERQLMRVDYGSAEARIDGWIPIDAVLDVWTDNDGVATCEALPGRAADLFDVPGFRHDGREAITVEVLGHDSPAARGRGAALCVPHHVRVRLTLGGPDAKQDVYRQSVRAAMADLVAATAGGRPHSGVQSGAAAVQVAIGATRAAAEGRTVAIDHRELNSVSGAAHEPS